MNLNPKHTLDTLRDTGISPLDAIRAKQHSPAELRRQAAMMREIGHYAFADLLNDEADCRETALNVQLKSGFRVRSGDQALNTADRYQRCPVILETPQGCATVLRSGDQYTVTRGRHVRDSLCRERALHLLRDLELCPVRRVDA
ncbi:MAG: hypothetical protein HC933_03840 [Pleurocapsa sp. SU_196_0]|nr:hypothetical protein [Pleurocapsa sp. SU_196_0]